MLDRVHRAAAILAAACIAAICALISAQVLLNAGTRAGLPLPATIPSYADFSGFLLAGATFLALPWTLRSGGHVRVTLLTRSLPRRAKWGAEMLVLALAAAFAGVATWYAGALVHESWIYGDVSPGIVAVPLWAPQSAMAAGLGLLTLALAQTVLETFRSGAPVIGAGDG